MEVAGPEAAFRRHSHGGAFARPPHRRFKQKGRQPAGQIKGLLVSAYRVPARKRLQRPANIKRRSGRRLLERVPDERLLAKSAGLLVPSLPGISGVIPPSILVEQRNLR